jgi:2-oxoisovalerate dehydrogenase E2 component (dihydrolipoyl transacylase)
MGLRDFLLPDLGEGLEDAEVVSWRVAAGDRVELNQTLVEVNTAKALVEIPAPWEGVVERLHAAEGDVVKVGQPLVSIRVDGPAADDGEAAAEAARDGADAQRPRRRAVLVGYGVDEDDEVARARSRATHRTDEQDTDPSVRATPPVRKLAKEMGIELSAVTGTGPGGRITREDVSKLGEAGSGAEPSPDATVARHPNDERIAVRGVRRLVAEKMSRSAREIPHVTTFLTVDATWVEGLRAELEADLGHRVTALPIIVRAFVETVREHRILNASFDAVASEIVIRSEVNVGIATETERGLMVPVVRNADRLGIAALGQEIAQLVESARGGTAAPGDLTGGTITVSNVGSFGAEFGTPIINHPEAAILAVGVIEPRALVVDGVVEARPAVTLSLSFDHRVLDGAQAGRALGDLKDQLESPFRLGSLPR